VLHSIRYQREEAKIQAGINLESAKAEAQSKKAGGTTKFSTIFMQNLILLIKKFIGKYHFPVIHVINF
jgi:hypothetical protein